MAFHLYQMTLRFDLVAVDEPQVAGRDAGEPERVTRCRVALLAGQGTPVQGISKRNSELAFEK